MEEINLEYLAGYYDMDYKNRNKDIFLFYSKPNSDRLMKAA